MKRLSMSVAFVLSLAAPAMAQGIVLDMPSLTWPAETTVTQSTSDCVAATVCTPAQ